MSDMTSNCPDKANCNKYKILIQKRLDGEISPKENEKLNEHLASCPDCLDEITGFQTVERLLKETFDEPLEVPEGFFESMAERLDEVEPARGLVGLLNSPFLAGLRTPAFTMASLVLVAFLTVGVGLGIADRMESRNADRIVGENAHAVMFTNGGDTIVLSGDEGDPDKYSQALDDLEKAYLESLDESGDKAKSEGIMNTSYNGEERKSPIY
ncbi:MAG: anti-sigma factor [bacterium]